MSHAEDLLRELGVTEPGEIDLAAIAWHLGLEIVIRPLSGCEARIVGGNGRGVISIDERKPPTRRRFSIGHEIGHWKHHQGFLLYCRSDEIGHSNQQIPDAERIANRYAADLLMPRFLFYPRAAALKALTWPTIRKLGEEFKTSPVATAIRAVDMGTHPVMLVCYSMTGRRWFVRSGLLPTDCWPLSELDARSNAMSILYGKTADERPKRFAASVWLSGASTMQVTEQTVLCEDEVLTLLTLG
mgnify:CR=1 FL=1